MALSDLQKARIQIARGELDRAKAGQGNPETYGATSGALSVVGEMLLDIITELTN